MVKSIGGLRFSKPARAAFQYCNVTFTLVGHIVSLLSGLPFADFVETRILEPLGMHNTTWTVPKDGTTAVQGYLTTWDDSRLRQKIPLPCIGLPRDSVLAAAGSISSTAADMAKWLAFLLRLAKNQANTDDLKVLKSETLKEILRSRVIANQQIGALPVEAGTSLWEEMTVPTYALGQLRGSYRGVDIASHNGRDCLAPVAMPKLTAFNQWQVRAWVAVSYFCGHLVETLEYVSSPILSVAYTMLAYPLL